jgi:hypothetical protein
VDDALLMEREEASRVEQGQKDALARVATDTAQERLAFAQHDAESSLLREYANKVEYADRSEFWTRNGRVDCALIHALPLSYEKYGEREYVREHAHNSTVIALWAESSTWMVVGLRMGMRSRTS